MCPFFFIVVRFFVRHTIHNAYVFCKLPVKFKSSERSSSRSIVDDICSKGGTFYHSALKLKEFGATNIYLYVTHCENSIYDGELLKNNGLIEKIYTTDSILTNTESPKIELVEEFRKNDPVVF